MDYLRNPIIPSVGCGCLTVLCSFIENKVNKKNRKILDYLKIFFITFLVIYISNYVFLNYIIQSKDEVLNDILKKNKESVLKDMLKSVKVDNSSKNVIKNTGLVKVANTLDVETIVNNVDVLDIIDTIDTGLPDF
jgi:hypothetical protein